MKKLFAFLVSVALLASCLVLPSFSAAAVSDELLVNGGFETGDLTGFTQNGTVTGTVSASGAHTGNYGLTLSNRGGQYHNYQQDITQTIADNGEGIYQASAWMKLASGETRSAKALLVIRYHYANAAASDYHYVSSGSVNLTDSWQQFNIRTYLDYSGIDQILIYPQVQGIDSDGVGTGEGPSFCLDDVSLKKSDDSAIAPHITESVEDRPEETTFGAIRWDAWFGHSGTTSGVCAQVERSLSPAQFHFRAPFFATVTAEDKVFIPEYTQAIFDKEMEYAIEAGVDYFAYVWYADDMRLARTYHTQSTYRDQVKMCACLDGNAIKKEYARTEITALLNKSYYMTVLDGRPLMYYYAGYDLTAIAEDIVYYRDYCEEHDIPAPYAVVMNVDPSTAYGIGGDASSAYAISGSDGQSYASLVSGLKDRWESSRVTGRQFVPNLTAGWHNQPRYYHPVTWTTASKDSWVEYATADEIAAHVTDALNYMARSDVKGSTVANTMILYGWNEHDEGGWICPTIAVDENGQQIYENDTPVIDDSRVKAVGKAIREWKGNAGEDTAPYVKVGDQTVPAGTSMVTVDLLLQNNPGIINMKLKLDYDQNVFTLIDAPSSSLFEDTLCSENTYDLPYTMVLSSDTASANVTANGTVLSLNFAVAADAPLGSYHFAISCEDTYNYDLDTVNFAAYDGTVTIEPAAFSISGTITSEEEAKNKITLSLTASGASEPLYTAELPGDAAAYEIPELDEGTYTLTASQKNCITVEKQIVIDGGNVTEPITLIQKDVAFDSKTLILSGEIALNFNVKLKDAARTSDAYMEFTISGRNGRTETVPFSESLKESNGTRYKFAFYVNSLQMAETVTATYHYGNGLTEETTYSVKQYIENRIENSTNAKMITLAKKIANFGYYAQMELSTVASHNFTVGTGEGYDYQEMIHFDEPDLNADLSAFAQTSTPGVLPSGITKVTKSLDLESKTSLIYYIAVDEDLHPDAPIVTVKNKNDNAVAVTVEKVSGRYKVTIPDIHSHELGDEFTISVDNGALTIHASALSYSENILRTSTKETNKKLVAALYEYYQANMDYREN